jgi:uncharacterized protein
MMNSLDKASDAQSVVRSFYAATAARDFAAIFELLSPDVIVNAPAGQAVVGGQYQGAEQAAKGLWGRLAQHWDGLTAQVHEVYPCDSHRVLVRGQYAGTNKLTAKTLSSKFAHFWTVHNGQVTQLDIYTDTASWNYAWGKTYEPTQDSSHTWASKPLTTAPQSVSTA